MKHFKGVHNDSLVIDILHIYSRINFFKENINE